VLHVGHIISPYSRGLPKTGQTLSRRTGDDGETELGWWIGRLNVNNKERFVLHLSNPDDIVIDRATGLLWPRNWTGLGGDSGFENQWHTCIDWANNLDWKGYDDWRLPNILELGSLVDSATSNPAINTVVFSNVNVGTTWSSTDYHWFANNARVIRWLDGIQSYGVQTLLKFHVAVRTA